MQTPRTEFAQALKAIANERGLDPSVILDTIKQAIIAAYRRDAKERGEDTEELDFEVEINPTNGEARVFAWPLEKPKQKKDVTPPGFGRIAAQTAKQVIHQKIREAEKGAIMEEFSGRAGNLVSGMILRFDGPNVRVDMGRTEAIMPVTERIPNERLSPNQRLTFLLKDIVEGARGKEIILSRADTAFVKKLFAREVPEIASGSVVIKQIAREPGIRTKIAVVSEQSGVDPVGSCVGQKGVRVQAVTNELGGERVDIIPWSQDSAELISAALSPAESINVSLDEKSKVAKVKAPEDQLSLAIGKEGQNVRLAAKLTGWRIEVEGVPVEPASTEGAEEEGKPETEPKKEEKVKKVETKRAKKKEEPESELEKVEKKEAVSEDTAAGPTPPVKAKEPQKVKEQEASVEEKENKEPAKGETKPKDTARESAEEPGHTVKE